MARTEDIKPENILLFTSCQYPHLIIGDFGSAINLEHCLSALPQSPGPWFRLRDGCGTVSYMPPERLEHQLPDRRSVKDKERAESAGRTREEVTRRWFEEEAKMDIWATGGECLRMLPPASRPQIRTMAVVVAYAYSRHLDDGHCPASLRPRCQRLHRCARPHLRAGQWRIFR
jgi:serine/threonine protein kinase